MWLDLNSLFTAIEISGVYVSFLKESGDVCKTLVVQILLLSKLLEDLHFSSSI